MLKEAGNVYPNEVYAYLKRNADMPRTALRYAVEKFPPNWKTMILKPGRRNSRELARFGGGIGKGGAMA
jgi:hypothetical protein